MSLYKDATLAMIPTAYKDGKLYSVRPTDGSGDFTFSRGTTATRVASSGYIEKGRENLLLQSNTFDTTWTNFNSTETDGQSGYDGTSDAWLLTKTGTNGNINQVVSSSGVTTFSVYAKSEASDWIFIRIGSPVLHEVYFDIANGVIGSETNVIDSNIEAAGNGYYRCSVTANVSSGSYVRFYVADSDGVTSGTSGSIYIQDAQLESGLVATDYIETTTTSVSAGILEDMPRLDYSGGASCPALLLEPQRTNLIVQSEGFATTAWTDNATNANVTANATRSPEGLQNAAEIEFTSSSAKIYDQFTNVASSLHIGSVWLKNRNIGSIRVRIEGGAPNILGRVDVNLANGTLSNAVGDFTPTIEDYGDGWYRVAVGDTSNATIATPSFNLDYLSSTGSFYAYGAQVEVGSYPTSYIPTYGASVTRSAEEYCKVNNIGEFPNEYTLFFEMEDIEAEQNNSVVMDLYSTTANTISVRTYETSGEGRLRFVDIVNNSTLFYLEHTSRKYCVRVNGTSVDGFTNGALASSATASSSMNNLDDLNIRCGSSQRSSTKYKQIVVFPTALTDSECIALTTL